MPVMRCTCPHPNQDAVHGKGMRLFNPCNKGFRCTVCGRETGDGAPKKKPAAGGKKTEGGADA